MAIQHKEQSNTRAQRSRMQGNGHGCIHLIYTVHVSVLPSCQTLAPAHLTHKPVNTTCSSGCVQNNFAVLRSDHEPEVLSYVLISVGAPRATQTNSHKIRRTMNLASVSCANIKLTQVG